MPQWPVCGDDFAQASGKDPPLLKSIGRRRVELPAPSEMLLQSELPPPKEYTRGLDRFHFAQRELRGYYDNGERLADQLREEKTIADDLVAMQFKLKN